MIFELCERTDRQTDVLMAIVCTLPGNEVKTVEGKNDEQAAERR